MGNMQTTLMLQKEEIEGITKETGFSHNQIVRLYSRFLTLDKDGRGYLDRQDLLRIPELAINPLADRIVDAFCTRGNASKNNDHINFRQFMNVMAHFRPTNKKEPFGISSREEKLRFAFAMYDTNNTNYITKENFKEILHMMVGTNISPEHLDHIAKCTLIEADKDDDGRLSFEEFCIAMQRTDIDEKMSIRFCN